METPPLASLGKQDFPNSSLYVIATPIGNLADITLRALYVLNHVDGIACEDKRHSLSLLKHFGINKPMLAIHEHNEREAASKLIEKLSAGQRWAYLSDAGTPGISDPGSRLVMEIQAHGYRAIPIPGPSALTAALSVCGEMLVSSGGRFQFLGFLPSQKNEFNDALERMIESRTPTVFYESPHRLKKTLHALHEQLENGRTLFIGRELSKKFESVFHLKPTQIPDWLESPDHLKGEFVLMLSGKDSDGHIDAQGPAQLAMLLANQISSKNLSSILQSMYGLNKNEAYELALLAKQGSI